MAIHYVFCIPHNIRSIRASGLPLVELVPCGCTPGLDTYVSRMIVIALEKATSPIHHRLFQNLTARQFKFFRRAITFATVFREHSQLAAMLRWLIPWP